LHFPTAITGVVLIYNIPGVNDPLKLTPDTLASIYLGEIRYWNDRRLVALNPRTGLPPAPIVLVERTEASATTHLWTDYLAKVSPAWHSRVGEAAVTISWPVAGLVAKGD